MSKKIPKEVLAEAWAQGVNATRRKAKALNSYPYNLGHMIQFVAPQDMKASYEAGIRAAAKVLLAWSKSQSK